MEYGLGGLGAVLALGMPVPVAAQAVAAPLPAVAAAGPDGLVPPAQLRSRPRFVSGAQPDEAPEVRTAAAKGGFGKVTAQAIVMPDGSLSDIVIIETSGMKPVDDAVMRVLAGWKLTSPMDKAGNKVATRAKFPFTLGHFPAKMSGGEPVFPDAAKAAFHNGKVVLSARIDQDGKVTDVKIARSSKSALLDAAAIAAFAPYRFERPKDLAGNPASFDVTQAFSFSQAEAGGGSYLAGLKSYKCSTFVGETDWWTQANPDAKPADQEFNSFMGGVSLIAPEALGWGNVGPGTALTRHPVAWQHALAACRNQPDSTFIEQYRKG